MTPTPQLSDVSAGFPSATVMGSRPFSSFGLYLSPEAARELVDELSAWVTQADADAASLAAAWPSIKQRMASDELIEPLGHLFEVTGAFYALSDMPGWRRTLRAIVALDFPGLPVAVGLVPYFAAFGLSACLVLGDHEHCLRVASRLGPFEPDHEEDPSAAVARVLAAFIEGNREAAQAATLELRADIDARLFDRLANQRYLPWCDAADAVLAKDERRLARALQPISDQSRRLLAAECRKWVAGRGHHLYPSLFWDHETSALLAVARQNGLRPDRAYATFDSSWLETVE